MEWAIIPLVFLGLGAMVDVAFLGGKIGVKIAKTLGALWKAP